jgi:hypothetical protein
LAPPPLSHPSNPKGTQKKTCRLSVYGSASVCCFSGRRKSKN